MTHLVLPISALLVRSPLGGGFWDLICLREPHLTRNSSIGFETTWVWAQECDAPGGSKSFACGVIDDDGTHESPTCSANAVSNTAVFVTTSSSSIATRYTPPPSVDPNVYSVFTSSYTTIITADAQTTTLTSTFASTFTSKIGESVATATNGAAPITSSGGSSAPKGAVTLSTGALIAIVVGPILVIAIGLGIFFFLRKRRSSRKDDAIRLDSATNYPPPNGPVGADQVHPYEVPSNEVSALPKKYTYTAPKVETYEIDDRTAMLREKKSASTMEMSTENHEGLRSPAPTYSEALMPVELDATPTMRAPNRGFVRY